MITLALNSGCTNCSIPISLVTLAFLLLHIPASSMLFTIFHPSLHWQHASKAHRRAPIIQHLSPLFFVHLLLCTIIPGHYPLTDPLSS